MKPMIISLSVLLVIALFIFFYTKQKKFGRVPNGERLERMKKSSHFKNGKFHNLSFTPQFAEGVTFGKAARESLFKRGKRRKPSSPIPSIKTNLLDLSKDQNVLVWFGHSSYFIQINGKRLLVDPVFSKNASPVPGTLKPFEGSNIFTVADLPDIDYLFISHDHYDHLDYETVMKLKPKTAKIVCGLGVGAHFERWGFNPENLIETDWYETLALEDGFTVHTLPSRHFSGRAFSRNNTLWQAYLLETPDIKLFLGGDSGYDSHFSAIGDQYGPIDLAILENGQYNELWKYIHSLPDQVLQVAVDLKAKRLFPVHSAKFALANHTWDEPLKKITELNRSFQIPLVTPMIGEVVYLRDENQPFTTWWTNVN